MHVEFPADLWTKSSYSDAQGACVEVAMKTDVVGVRDTKNRTAGHFTVSARQFTAFVGAVKTNDGWRG